MEKVFTSVARRSAVIGVVTVLIAGFFSTNPLIAGASEGEVSLYLSAPYVQGSHASGPRVYREDFNGFVDPANTENQVRSSSNEIAMGTMTSATGEYDIELAKEWGGASVGPDVDEPTQTSATPLPGSRYISNRGNEISIALAKPAKYVGLWWTAGETSVSCESCNTITFFSGSREVASVNESQVATALSEATVTNLAGSTYPSDNYLGNPAFYGDNNSQNYAYLNLIITGGRTVDRIVLSGNGFEFDNLVTASSTVTPTPNMVFVLSQEGSWPSRPSPTPSIGTTKATLVVGGFAHNSRKLTPKMKNRIERWLDRHSHLGTLACTGFTSLPRRSADVTLSTKRGITACRFSKTQRVELQTSVSPGIQDPRPGSNVRRVRLVLTP
jgi:hypothetical protein